MILAADGITTNFVSPLLNPENAGYTYPNGPATLDVDVAALAGGSVTGRRVIVNRLPDPDLSGSGGQGGTDEAAILALGEVEVYGLVTSASDVNLARTGSPAPRPAKPPTTAPASIPPPWRLMASSALVISRTR